MPVNGDGFTSALFADPSAALDTLPAQQVLAPGALLMRGLATPQAAELFRDLQAVLAIAPLRHLVTPGGLAMSVAMSNCGPLGWSSDRKGYRYEQVDPDNGRPWPLMPASFRQLAARAAAEAGFAPFDPDACLINCYAPGARLSLHQDRDERDFSQPIVSVSLGLPAVFLFGGRSRSEKPARVLLDHGDVVAWGGASRLRYHGVLALKDGQHALTGRCRFNLTFRRAS